jgi:hypothetical protein
MNKRDCVKSRNTAPSVVGIPVKFRTVYNENVTALFDLRLSVLNQVQNAV